MNRVLLLTVALLGASHFLKQTEADGDHPPKPPVVRVVVATDSASRQAVGIPSHRGLGESCQAEPEDDDSDDDASKATDSHRTPAWFPDSEIAVIPPATTRGPAVVAGDLGATPERALDDAYGKLERAVSAWLVPDAPASWKAPRKLIRSLVTGQHVRSLEREYATVYQAALQVDLSVENRATLVNAYQQDLGAKRLGWLGGALGFVLACLAVLTGYIRVDEATKGYYTNRLRLLAAAGVGVAGVALYQFLFGF